MGVQFTDGLEITSERFGSIVKNSSYFECDSNPESLDALRSIEVLNDLISLESRNKTC